MGVKMTLREKIGQMIVTGFQTEKMSDEFAELVREYKVANTILFSYNTKDEESIRKLCTEIQKLVKEETGQYAFISIDQEGGVVTRLPETCANIPGAMAVAWTEDPEKAHRAAYITGCELKELGINFNLAPVLDINSNSKNPVIGVRSFGSDAEAVTEFGCAMVRGYTDAGILCSVKHFPGHGDTEKDSHLSLPCVTKTYEELKNMELRPFEAAVKAGAGSVTMAHILYPELEAARIPATMSGRLIDILRKDLGFKGMVISDCMEMDAVKKYYGVAEGAKMAVKAGVDLIFISHTAALAKEAVLAIERAVEEGEIEISRIDEAVERILNFKKIWAEPVSKINNASVRRERKEFADALFLETVHFVNTAKAYHRLGARPVFLSCAQYRATLASSETCERLSLAEYLKKDTAGEGFTYSQNPSVKEIGDIAAAVSRGNYTDIVIATYNGHLNRGQLMLAEALLKEAERQGLQMVMAALRNPYDLEEIPDTVVKIAAYEYSTRSLEAIKRLLFPGGI